jgi:hypothetical protein
MLVAATALLVCQRLVLGLCRCTSQGFGAAGFGLGAAGVLSVLWSGLYEGVTGVARCMVHP